MNRVLPVGVGLVLIGSTLPSLAATINYSDSKALPNDTNVTLSISKFDPSLGELTGVYLKVWVQLTGVTVKVDNDASAAQTGTARVLNTANSLTTTASFLKSDDSTFNKGNLAINASQTFLLAATQGDQIGRFDETGLADYAAWQPGAIRIEDEGEISSERIDRFQGLGNFGITTNATYLTSATFTGNDGFFQGNTPNATFGAAVTYSYVAVPEPAVFGVMVAGACSMLGLRKRQKVA